MVIVSFRIYRGGRLVAETTDSHWQEGLRETDRVFEVGIASVDDAGLESPKTTTSARIPWETLSTSP